MKIASADDDSGELEQIKQAMKLIFQDKVPAYITDSTLDLHLRVHS